MKIIYLIFCFSIYSAFSQLLPSGNYDIYEKRKNTSESNSKIFYSLGINTLKIKDSYGFEGDLELAVINNSNFIIGGGINSVLFNTIKLNTQKAGFLRYANGFFYLGYIINVNKQLNLYSNVNVGVGRMNSSNVNIGIFNDVNGDWYYYFEPKLGADFRVYKNNYVSSSISYRIYKDIENYNMVDNDFNGFVIGLNYKLIFN